MSYTAPSAAEIPAQLQYRLMFPCPMTDLKATPMPMYIQSVSLISMHVVSILTPGGKSNTVLWRQKKKEGLGTAGEIIRIVAKYIHE